jgi:hypothetical protein
MSTTFGVKIPTTGEIIPIARRFGGDVYFINPIAELLPDEMEVEAIDNSPQGIFTVGDIKESLGE